VGAGGDDSDCILDSLALELELWVANQVEFGTGAIEDDGGGVRLAYGVVDLARYCRPELVNAPNEVS